MDNKSYAINMNGCGFMDPQQQLGASLAQNDICGFRLALDMGADPNIMDNKNNNIYERALKTYGCAEFVAECLKNGSSPNYINQQLNKAAINFAADSRDPQIIQILLNQKGIEVQVDRKYAQLTPLNSLAKNLTAENAVDVQTCIRLLLNYGASPNIPDQREMTPLHYVLKNRKIDELTKREIVQLFLQEGNKLDIDSFRDGEVRTLLNDDYPDFKLPAPRSQTNEASVDYLIALIRSGDMEKFLQEFQNHQLVLNKQLNKEHHMQLNELLFESIERCMSEAFNVILQTGVDINLLRNGNSAIEIAAIKGNWYALQQLITQSDLKLRPQEQLLITVIRKLDEVGMDERCDFTKCFYILLNSKLIDVNETDASSSTPLHYAVKYRNRRAIQELLKHGAYIGMKNKFSDLPIDDLHADILEEHFDSCITTNGLKTGDQNFEITMNYMNLMTKQNEAKHENLHDEMSPIAFIAESREHKHLLQHPLITSFLFLKWHRLSLIFYINFLFYVFFAVSIITHTLLKFRESDYEYVTALFGLFSWIGIIYLLCREIIQFIMSPIMYFRSLINYMEIALIILSIMTCIEPSYDQDTKRVIAVFTILLVALELCLLVGSLPVLSISTHMLMLRAVSTSFIKSFTLYSIFVITFSLCFYILFGKPQPTENNDEKNPESEGFNKFSNPFAAVIKTIVMLTGEFDAGDIDFHSLYSYLVFLLFVVFMSIVLFNLLNGLAVSDTQVIKAQAELNGSICRANVLSRYEEVFIGSSGRVSLLFKHEPLRSICRRLINVYPNYIAGRQITIVPNNNNKVLIPVANTYEMTERGHELRNSKSVFLPLSNNNEPERQKKALEPPVRPLVCCFPCMRGRCAEMDTRTVKRALCVLEQKTVNQQEKQRALNTERRLKGIEDKLEKLFELLQKNQN